MHDSSELFKFKCHFIKFNCKVIFASKNPVRVFDKDDVAFVIDVSYDDDYHDQLVYKMIVLSNEFLVYERRVNIAALKQKWFEVID